MKKNTTDEEGEDFVGKVAVENVIWFTLPVTT